MKRHSNSNSLKDDALWRLQKQLKELRQQLRSSGHMAKGSIKSKMHEVGESMQELYDDGRDRTEEVESDVSDFIKTKPFQVVLAAIGVGVLLSFLFRRR